MILNLYTKLYMNCTKKIKAKYYLLHGFTCIYLDVANKFANFFEEKVPNIRFNIPISNDKYDAFNENTVGSS